MRRQYYIHYYKNFGNTYDLIYADTEDDLTLIPEDAERITRKEAEAFCSRENYRRKCDPSFSGFADNMIYPVGLDSYKRSDIYNDHRFYRNGYIWERSAV